MSNHVAYYTAEGLKKLKDELHQLKAIERPRISQQIAEARDKGDLSENAEYDAAKEAQGMLELRINELEKQFSSARILDASEVDTSQVTVLSKVTIVNLKNKAKVTYQLVSESEADLKAKKISVSSPMGQGLLGKKIGEVATVTTPNGIMEFKVEDISI